jgi:hypothetical protein
MTSRGIAFSIIRSGHVLELRSVHLVDTATYGISWNGNLSLALADIRTIGRVQGMHSQLSPSRNVRRPLGEHFPDDESGPMLFLIWQAL